MGEVIKMLSVILMLVCLIKAKMGIDDETITKSTKVVSIIECTLNFIFLLLKIADGTFTRKDIVPTIIGVIILLIGLNIRKIKIAVLDSHFRGE